MVRAEEDALVSMTMTYFPPSMLDPKGLDDIGFYPFLTRTRSSSARLVGLMQLDDDTLNIIVDDADGMTVMLVTDGALVVLNQLVIPREVFEPLRQGSVMTTDDTASRLDDSVTCGEDENADAN